MYNKLLTAILILFVATAAVYAESAEEIFNKSIAATGADKEGSIKSSYMEIAVSVMGMEIPSKVWKSGDKFRLESNQMEQDIVVTYNGKKGWTKMAGNVMEMPADQVQQTQKQTEPPVNPLKDIQNQEGIKIEKAGKTKIDGVTTFNIKVTDKDGKVSNFYIDSKTYLIVKMTGTSERGPIEVKFKEYKDFDGIKMPTKILVSVGGMEMTTSVKDFKVNPDINDSLFEKPE
jgi:outer membrane lipoprotein-sorting protein